MRSWGWTEEEGGWWLSPEETFVFTEEEMRDAWERLQYLKLTGQIRASSDSAP